MTQSPPRSISNETLSIRDAIPSGRPTAAYIDIGNLEENYRVIRSAIGLERELLAVVKAEGYGHGATECARAFLDAGAKWLGVATIEEGEALRGTLTGHLPREREVRILVMSGTLPELAPRVLNGSLDAVVWDMAQVEALSSAAKLSGRKVRVHVKVDSGMHRLGLAPGETTTFIRKAMAMDGLEVVGLMSHLAQADEEWGRKPTKAQFEVVQELTRSLEADGILPPIVHCANSAGGLVYPEAPGHLVRSGIALYGSLPRTAQGVETRPVMTLKSSVLQVKRVSSGGRVGYGGTYQRAEDGRIAVVAMGYADGYPRLLSNRADTLIRGRRAPVVGRVSMDMLTIDVSDRDEVQVGDEVVLLGEQGEECVSGEELASLAHTISYEIFSRMGCRVPRIFLREGKIIGQRILGGSPNGLSSEVRNHH